MGWDLAVYILSAGRPILTAIGCYAPLSADSLLAEEMSMTQDPLALTLILTPNLTLTLALSLTLT